MDLVQTIRRVGREEAWGLLILVPTWLVFFSRILSGRFVYFLNDLKIIYYPLEIAYASFQAAGQLPAWSTLFGFGQPLLAWGQLGFFTPLHVVLRALNVPPLDLLQASVVLYFGLGLAGMYVFLRRVSVAPLAASLGAVIFTFSGFNIGHLNHVNFYTGTMLLPWLLVALHWLLSAPSLRKAVMVALVATAMALSAQPQVVLYCFIIASIIGAALLASSHQHLVLKIALLALSAVLFLLLSSFATLPLAEFIPLTERGQDLATAELFEFSYPPSHTITLLLPHFYGDHTNYWGAKGYEELAAFVGLIPLFLAGLALTSWRAHRALTVAGTALIVIGIIMTLGIHSPLYRWLVESHTLTNLTIPGRFVFFFDVGVALLAALGLLQLQELRQRSRPEQLTALVAGAAPILVILGLAVHQTLTNELFADRAFELATSTEAAWLALLLSAASLSWVSLSRTRSMVRLRVLVGVTAGTLVALGWNYNALTTRSFANAENIFQDELAADPYARLYSRGSILTDERSGGLLPTGPIANAFSIHQPVTITNTDSACITVPLRADQPGGALLLSLREAPSSPTLQHYVITAEEVLRDSSITRCFANLPTTELYLTLASDHDSGIRGYLEDTAGRREVLLVRVASPTGEQLEQSRKPARLAHFVGDREPFDEDLAILSRHLNVSAGASSARWIGALSIKPYREFIEFFFANDKEEAFDGEGLHAIERHRHILDLAGVTHLVQLVPPETADRMTEAGFIEQARTQVGDRQVKLYRNPNAYPKAFLVNNHQFLAPADETRTALAEPDFDPRELVYVSGPSPPLVKASSGNGIAAGTAEIVRYENSAVEVLVDSPTDTWLVITDSTTSQWQTYIDGQPVQRFVANTIFKAAQVPAGQHTVLFEYHSPAIARAQRYTVSGLVLAGLLLALPFKRRTAHSHEYSPPQTS